MQNLSTTRQLHTEAVLSHGRFMPRFLRWWKENKLNETYGEVQANVDNFPLPPFHASAHVVQCQKKHDGTAMKGAGVPHGERPEIAWAVLGPHGQLSQYQSPLHRELWLEHVLRRYEMNMQNNIIVLLMGWWKKICKVVSSRRPRGERHAHAHTDAARNVLFHRIHAASERWLVCNDLAGEAASKGFERL